MILILQKFGLFAAFLITLSCTALPARARSPIPDTSVNGNEAADAAVRQVRPGALTQAQIRELLSRLPDAEVRRLLLAQLLKTAAPDASAARTGLADEIAAKGEVIRNRLSEVMSVAPRVPNALALIETRLDETGGLGNALVALGLAVFGGLGAGWLWRRGVYGQRDRLAERSAATGATASIAVFGDAFIWLVLELLAVLISYAVATVLVFAFWHDNGALRLFLSTYVAAIAVIGAVMAVAEFYLPRDFPVYRLLPLSDRATRRIKFFAIALAFIWTFGFFTCRLVTKFGAETLPHLFLVVCVATLFIVVLISMFVSVRGEIAALICGAQGGASGWMHLRSLLASSWHVLAGAYIVLLWALSLGQNLLTGRPIEGPSQGLFGLALFIAVPAVDIIFGHFIDARLGRDSALGGAIRRTLRVFLIVGAGAIFLDLWGLDMERLEAAGAAGWLMRAFVDVGIVALIGYAVWQLSSAYFDRLLARQTPPAAGAGAAPVTDGGTGATRAATLLPLLRAFAMATIAVIAALTALSGLGVDIGPLLAGAGVVGIAVGFGAQTLVRDVVSGIFFLIDDAFRTGEYIEVGAGKGTVEKISVRSLRLRHHNGPIYTVPFGEIRTLTNYSRDWVVMKLPLRLTYDTDPDTVRKIIKSIGAEMAADEALGRSMLEPPKSQGVLQMEDSAMILSVKFKAKPGEQFTLRRELLHRIRAAFAEAGIHFASREVTVRVTGEEQGRENGEKAGAAAARVVLDEDAAALQGALQRSGDR